MACETRRPRHQSQLNRKFGGKFGGVNCTAMSAAMVAEAVLCGPDRPILGKAVRAASDEPVPGDLPGLTLGQVTAALEALTDRAVQLTVKEPITMAHLERRLRRGQVAVLQVKRQALIDKGHRAGRAFSGPHAVAIGFDRDEVWVDDPLGPKKFTSSFEELAFFASSLELGGGTTVADGFAWAAFGRRPRAARAASTIRIPKGTMLKRFKMKGGLYWEMQVIKTPAAVHGTCSESARTHAHPAGPAFAGPASGHRPRNLGVVLSGPDFIRGFGVVDGAPGVEIDDADDGPPVAAELDVEAPTSPDLIDDPAVFDVSDADRAALDAADIEPAGVKNGDVGEPMLPDDFEEDDEDDPVRRDGS